MKLGILLIALLLAACAPSQESDKLQVVATTGMVGDLAKNIGGEFVEVKALMGPGVDPHLYKASEGDVQTLSEADLIFYSGLHLEAKMGDVLEEMGERAVPVTRTLPREELLDFPPFENQYDPHVWFNVHYWRQAAQVVLDELVLRDPTHADSYRQNAETYFKQLDELDASVHSKAETLPPEQRILVTAHDAFRYFGREYGFQVIGLQGISTQAEAGTRDVQELVNFIVSKKIKAIFVESSVPERNLKAVQEASRAQGWDVQIGGQLYSDAMGDAGTFEGTYIGMVTANIDTIVGALGDENASG
ncbi:zinc ABC transporter substrate-binding protein [Candidatus Woesearchaeota archaeon]|nr:zinc ABC transporter substrate-binding protein [Candidatus Woesearchaeota archaeon]